MTLSAVQEQMVKGAEAAIDETLSYQEAVQAFAITLIDTAIKRTGNQNRAAMKLATTPALVSRVMSGKRLVRGRTKQEPTETR